jgi:proteasome accessory factor B
VQKVIERILNLLAFLLTAGRPVTADEIRHTVKGYDQPSDEAFRRTFERDKDLLRTLGVPLETTYTDIWEVELGYVVPSDQYTLEDPGFTDDERSALLLAAEAVRFGGERTGIDALFKLGGARRSTSAAPVRADLGQDLTTLGELFSAVTQRRTVRFDYRNRSRTIQPFGMVHRYGHWYLVGPETADLATIKAFRIDRMGSPSVGPEAGKFKRPKSFDASAVLEGIGASESDETARIRFDNDVVDVAMNRSRAATIVEAGDESTLIEVPMADEGSMISWVLGFDDRAEIVSPASLRAAFIEYVEVSA